MKPIIANNFRASILLSLSTRSPSCWNSKKDLSGVPPANKYIEEPGRKTTEEWCLRPGDETYDSEEERKTATEYTVTVYAS